MKATIEWNLTLKFEVSLPIHGKTAAALSCKMCQKSVLIKMCQKSVLIKMCQKSFNQALLCNFITVTVQKMKFLIKDFFWKCKQTTGNCGFDHVYWRNP